MNNLPIILQQLRTQKGIYQKELACYLKTSVGTVSNYERGVHEPDLETLVKLADYYNVSADFLLGRTVCPFFNDMTKIIIADDYPISNLAQLLPNLTRKDRICLVHIIQLMYDHSAAKRKRL